jgi:putative DNA methylase
MDDKPRLIEVAFPLKQASLASVHEKNVRHGHISTLHIWPARRPLAACRAALLATLLPDPSDAEKRRDLLAKIGGNTTTKAVEETDDEGNTVVEDKQVVEGGILAWGQEDDKLVNELREEVRRFYGGNAPKLLDPFAGGGAIPFEAMRLGCEVTASDLSPVAWFILKCTLEYPQRFAEKKWPLPDFVREWPDFVEDFLTGKVKKRKANRKSHFSDPRQLALTELPAADLAWHVRAWGRWVLERTTSDLGAKYPAVNREPTVAYLWARTARDKPTGGRIPLLKTFWLCRKKGRRVAFLPVPKEDKSGVDFHLLQEPDLANPQRVLEEFPFLKEWDVRADDLADFLKRGTKSPSGIWSPVSGRPGLIALTTDDLRRQGRQGLLDVQMTCVVVDATRPGAKKTYRRYRKPTETEVELAVVQQEELESLFCELPFGFPNEPVPIGSSRRGGGSAFTVPTFGFDKWYKLFTTRQLFALATIMHHSRLAAEQLRKRDVQACEAISAYLSVVLDRVADRSSTICTWTVNWDKIRNTFARFALPVAWDFVEGVPIADASGGYAGQLELVAKFIDHSLKMGAKSSVPLIELRSAIEKPLSTYDIIVTDPPYYDAIPYSDLMDFFYVWLRRTLHGVSAEIDDAFRDPVGPKWNHQTNDGEIIDDSSRFGGDNDKSREVYEDGMFRAFQACHHALKPEGRLVVVFANKQSDAWESLVSAMIRAGFVVDASWPIQTEMPNRTRSVSSAALSSSVWIVCRKRNPNAAVGWQEVVVDRMKHHLFDPRDIMGGANILQYYFDLGIQGPDFIWAALGPALEAYSAHPFVKKTAGGVMTVAEFLSEVRRLVLHFSLGELPGFKDFQKETQGRGESLDIDPVTQYYLLHRAYFTLDPAPAGACILYANACGKKETELRMVWNILEQGGKQKSGRPRNDSEEDESEDIQEDSSEGKGNEYRLLTWQERVRDERLGDPKAGERAPLIDKLQRLMYLLQQNRTTEMQQHFESWGLSNERAFKPLLQAVRELAIRDRQDAERRLVEALATQLRMNKKTIIVANELREVALFDAVEDVTHLQVN